MEVIVCINISSNHTYNHAFKGFSSLLMNLEDAFIQSDLQ